MAPPRWPFLVEIDAVSQLSLFFASNKRTTVPLGMRIVGRNLERDSYFIAPWGLHLLYRRLMRRYDRAQQVLAKLRETATAQTQAAWPPLQTAYPPGQFIGGGNVSYQWTNVTTTATPGFSYHNPCSCPSCLPASSIPQTP